RDPPRARSVFPYTTLFRSGEGAVGGRCNVLLHIADGNGWQGGETFGKRRCRRREFRRRNRLVDEADCLRVLAHQHIREEIKLLRDRKSTRLNSSHVKISYA